MEKIIDKLLEFAPQFMMAILIFIGLWVIFREYRALRGEIEENVKKEVSARIGEMIGDVRTNFEQVKLTIFESQRDFEGMFSNLNTKLIGETASIQHMSEEAHKRLAEVEKNINILDQQVGRLRISLPEKMQSSARDLVSLASSERKDPKLSIAYIQMYSSETYLTS